MVPSSDRLALRLGAILGLFAVIFWLVGVVCFSGSLYVLALDPTQKWAGPITPIGGLLLLFGWGWLFVTLLRKPPI